MSDDVVGFYPSLDHLNIYENSASMLEQWRLQSKKTFPKEFKKSKDKNIIITKINNEIHIVSINALKDAIAIILKCHTTQFIDQIFIQTNGTTEGDKPSPDFAMIAAKPFDDKIFELMGNKLIGSGRYIDDGLRIGNFNINDAKNVINEINKITPRVQFTFEFGDWGGKRIHFLDLYLIITPVGIITEMYYKPTELFSYLKISSAHPDTTWISVIKGISSNLRSHCNDGTINIHSRIQAALLIRQGYNKHDIFKEFNTIIKKSQNSILFKHTNYYNKTLMNKNTFLDQFEIYKPDSSDQNPNSESQINISDNNELIIINPKMYKLQKNDPRIINLVVPFHNSMDSLKLQLKQWHDSLLAEMPAIAALFPKGCIRLVQKRLPNLKERLAPKFTPQRFFFGNINCIMNNKMIGNSTCNICSKKINRKYKIFDIHKKSLVSNKKINVIQDIPVTNNNNNNKINNNNKKLTKHTRIIQLSNFTQDTNLTSTQPNSANLTTIHTKNNQKTITISITLNKDLAKNISIRMS